MRKTYRLTHTHRHTHDDYHMPLGLRPPRHDYNELIRTIPLLYHCMVVSSGDFSAFFLYMYTKNVVGYFCWSWVRVHTTRTKIAGSTALLGVASNGPEI